MELLDLSLEQSVDNIAVDEALLEEAERNGGKELLRLWEPPRPMVVIGRSSPIEREVHLDFCASKNIEVFRRCSGGASIVCGPGCLMFAVLLDYRIHPQLRMLDEAHRFVMSKILQALTQLGVEAELQGTCDLTIGNRKFAGNAMRCKRNWLIYHGTLLCDFDLQLIESCLAMPVRQPEYRTERSHLDFLTQLPVDIESLRQALIESWTAKKIRSQWPSELTQELVNQKYLTPKWNFKL